jgi:hypothetical protein
MELWQMDVMGRVFLADGQEVKVVTGLDDHSRFIERAGHFLRLERPRRGQRPHSRVASRLAGKHIC